MCKKVTFSLFHRKFENGPFWAQFGPFWPKIPKKRRFFAFFSKTAHWNFLIFCTKPSLWSRKNDGFTFLSKIQKWPILAQIEPNLTQIWAFRSSKIKKKMFPSFFTKIEHKLFRAKKIHFSPFWPSLWPPSPHT